MRWVPGWVGGWVPRQAGRPGRARAVGWPDRRRSSPPGTKAERHSGSAAGTRPFARPERRAVTAGARAPVHVLGVQLGSWAARRPALQPVGHCVAARFLPRPRSLHRHLQLTGSWPLLCLHPAQLRRRRKAFLCSFTKLKLPACARRRLTWRYCPTRSPRCSWTACTAWWRGCAPRPAAWSCSAGFPLHRTCR